VKFGPRRLRQRWRLRGLSQEAVFTKYYEDRMWRSNESVSGQGSTVAVTEHLRSGLPPLLADLNVSTLLDVPSGDFNWMSEVDLGNVEYIGGDIVPALIKANSEKFGRSGREFRVIDLTESDLPNADALLVRDCLIHLDFAAIDRVLRNVARSQIRWLLVSEYPELAKNVDSSVGPATPVSLSLPPFSLGPKTAEIADARMPNGLKTLAVWDVDLLRRQPQRSGTRSR
jgi:hypothetical protein